MEKHISQLISSTNLSAMDGKDSSPSSNLPTKHVSNPESTTPIGTILKAASAKKLSECTDGEIAKRLSMVYFMIGLRPQHFPTKEEDVFLFSYIRKKYARLSLDELYLAFDLAIHNQLDIDDCKVYDQFSIEYLVRILNSYRRYASKHHEEYKPPTMIENKVVITKEEKIADIEQLINAKQYNPFLIPNYMYDWMVELEYIKQTEEDKVRLYNLAIRSTLSELRNEYEKSPGDAAKRREYAHFKKQMECHFASVTETQIRQIDRHYKLHSIVETINNQKQTK